MAMLLVLVTTGVVEVAEAVAALVEEGEVLGVRVEEGEALVGEGEALGVPVEDDAALVEDGEVGVRVEVEEGTVTRGIMTMLETDGGHAPQSTKRMTIIEEIGEVESEILS